MAFASTRYLHVAFKVAEILLKGGKARQTAILTGSVAIGRPRRARVDATGRDALAARQGDKTLAELA